MPKLIYSALLILAVVLLASCSGEEPVEQVTEPQEEVINNNDVESELVTDAETDADLSVRVETPTNYCLDCHTDKVRLIDTARPEEEVIKESEGPG
jgi:PBP1b-binding outer membrane lipoprotein LpoB